MFLLVDNSNTRTKFMWATKRGLMEETLHVVNTADITVDLVQEIAQKMPLKLAIVASVVPRTGRLLSETLQGYGVTYALNACIKNLPLTIEYDSAATLGADRLANAIAAAVHYPLPCIAVDAGTAVTYDVILPGEQKARYVGGAISPGLHTMTLSLNSATAALPKVSIQRPASPIGSCTHSAIQSGVYWGMNGMVEGVVRKIQDEIGAPCTVVATGGDAPMLKAETKVVNVVDELLSFKGLLQVALRMQ